MILSRGPLLFVPGRANRSVIYSLTPPETIALSWPPQNTHKGAMKIPQDVYESLRSPITFPFILALTRGAHAVEGCRARGTHGCVCVGGGGGGWGGWGGGGEGVGWGCVWVGGGGF